jgi:hypothetical protein
LGVQRTAVGKKTWCTHTFCYCTKKIWDLNNY